MACKRMRRGVEALVLVAAAVCAPAGVRAQGLADYDYTNLSFRGAGLALGYIWPTKVQGTPEYTLRVDLGYLGPNVRIVPTLSYWASDMRASELDKLAESINKLPALQQAGVTLTGHDLAPVRWSNFALDVDGQWVVSAQGGPSAYAGFGLGLHALSGSGDAIRNTFVEDLLDRLAPAASISAGLESPVGDRLHAFGELRLTAMGDVQYAGVRLGGTLMTGRSGSTR